jgi:hypothetical protein
MISPVEPPALTALQDDPHPRRRVWVILLFLLLVSASILVWALIQLGPKEQNNHELEMAIVATMTRGFLVAATVFWAATKATKNAGLWILSALIAWLGFSGVLLAVVAFKMS